ncbi:MAG: hypothetical protein JW774_03700 [Candidatus Aureabacteria bacterium]|nr:hypothetical protein [Candidatus Auribacterota bacterium]
MPLKQNQSEAAQFDEWLKNSSTGIRLEEIINPFLYPFIHRIVFLIILLCGISLIIFDLKTYSGKMKVLPIKTEDDKETPDLKEKAVPVNFGEILAVIQSKTIFKATKMIPPPPPPKSFEPKGPTLEEKIRSLTLIGILNENPVQAIIESKQNREVYYIKSGDTLLDMEVVSIAPGEVTLRYKDETKILR